MSAKGQETKDLRQLETQAYAEHERMVLHLKAADEAEARVAGLREKAKEHSAAADSLLKSANAKQAEADALAEDFRGYFEEASQAFEEGDGALAAELSDQGHAAMEACEALNAEIKFLREQAFGRIEQAKSLRSQADAFRSQAADQREIARHHKTRRDELRRRIQELRREALRSVPKRGLVVGFDKSGILSDRDVSYFLTNSVPKHHLPFVRKVVYSDEVRGDHRGYTLGYTSKNNVIIINCPPGEFSDFVRPFMMWAVAHEVGHVVDRELSAPIRAHFPLISEPYLTDVAERSAAELFAETYAMYILNPDPLRSRNPGRYEFMRDKVFLGREYL